jgi:hypothetical protein
VRSYRRRVCATACLLLWSWEARAEDTDFGDVDLEALFEGPVEAATADVDTPPAEATRRELQGEELTTMPGTRGDALRAIEVLPGVGRVPFASNDGPPPLRGSGPEESRVLLDGVPVPLLYHFGGLTSFFNSNLLERVELRPGNHSSRFGRSSAGIVDARVRSSSPDRMRAALEVSLLDNQAWVDAPVGNDTSLAVAARRSNIDLVFSELVPADTLRATAAPVYYDYQAILRHRLSDTSQVRVLGYGSRDHMRLVLANANADDPALHGSVEGRLEFHRLQAHWDAELGKRFLQRLTVSAGPRTLLQNLGDLRARMDSTDLYGRADWSALIDEHVRADFGVDVESEFFSGTYSGPLPTVEGDPSGDDPLGTLETASLTKNLTLVRPGAYAELSYRPTEDVLILPGVRTDLQGESSQWSVDPRLSARWQVTPEFATKAALGSFTRPVTYYLLIPELGNPDVAPERTVQGSLGFEATPEERLSLDVDLFAKRWTNRIVATPGGEPPRFDNSGLGRAVGLETLLRARPLPRLMGLVAYTLSRSQRYDGAPAPTWRIYEGDQTHNVSVVATYDLGAGWKLGGRFRYVTGTSETPVVGAVYAAEVDQYRPVYGAPASRRRPAFHQLDVRVDKRWDLGAVALTTYLEVLNAYNAENQEGTNYSYDYSRSEAVSGLPLFPNLGVRGEL